MATANLRTPEAGRSQSAWQGEGMTLKIASDEIEEVRRGLSFVYGEVIRELGQRSSCGSEAGIQLCRRKWKLEALLGQLRCPEEAPAVLEMLPRREHTTLERVAA